MERYKDIEPIIDFIKKGLNNPDKSKAFGHDAIEILTELEYAPTAEVVEVKHGEWIDRDGKTWCSLCEQSNKQYKPPYCPHCGAKMDGRSDT